MIKGQELLERNSYITAFQKKWTTYGDLLELLANPVNELTLFQPESLHDLGCLHDSIFGIAANLCVSIVALALTRNKYADSKLELSDPIVLENTKDDYTSIFLHTKNGIALKTRSSIEFLRFSNIEDPDDEYAVFIFQGWPEWLAVNSQFPVIQDSLVEKLKSEISVAENGLATGTKRMIVFDGVLLHLLRPYLNSVKEDFKTLYPNWQWLSIEQFLNQMFGKDWTDYLIEFDSIRMNAFKFLEEAHPFLIPRREATLTFRSRNQILGSKRKSSGGEVRTQVEIEGIIQQATNGIEGLLQVLYRRNFRRPPQQDWTFNNLLIALAETVKYEFGEEIFRDLEYLNQVRNSVSHPREVNLNNRDLIKSVGKAFTFMQLFDDFVGLSKGDE